jgi:protein-S-isoprenylcysteine O-methyltransferase Ste14
LTGLPDGMARIRALDLRSGLTAMRDPAGFRASGDPVEIERGQLAVTLGPYSVVRVDIV